MADRPLAVVTGASSGIGFELAKCCAEDGHDLVICANEPEIERAAGGLRQLGASVDAVEADLGTEEGVNKLWDAVKNRRVDALLANAGRGLGHAFLDQDFHDAKDVIDLNVTGTVSLIHKVGRQMRDRGDGRILITSSIASRLPGAYQAVYNASKAFLESFSYALRNELKGTNVTVTCLMPGPTDTAFFERGDLEDSRFGESSMMQSDPAKVARDGYEAMKEGRGGITSGLMNKLQVMFANVIPERVLAEMHRHLASTRRDREAARGGSSHDGA